MPTLSSKQHLWSSKILSLRFLSLPKKNQIWTTTEHFVNLSKTTCRLQQQANWAMQKDPFIPWVGTSIKCLVNVVNVFGLRLFGTGFQSVSGRFTRTDLSCSCDNLLILSVLVNWSCRNHTVTSSPIKAGGGGGGGGGGGRGGVQRKE